jgi:chemotaxis protein MotB
VGKKKHEEHMNHEAWIIPYADMVTLLFAFFVVMYAMSLTDKEKMEAVSESVSDAFVGSKSMGDRVKTINLLDLKGNPPMSQRFVAQRDLSNERLVEEIQKQLELEGYELIFQEEASPIQFIIDERGLVISISAGYLFAPNSVEIPVENYPVLQIVSEVVRESDRLISVEGHTDAVAVVGTKESFDNWDLSVLRATAMTRLLIEEFGVSPLRISAAGWGPYRPLGDNRTEVGQAQNRRVDIVMLNAQLPGELRDGVFVPGQPAE